MFGWLRRKRPPEGDTGGRADGTGLPPDLEVEAGPHFWVPGIEDRARAAEALDEVRQRLAQALGAAVADRAYAALAYEHDGFPYRAEVGEADPRANEVVRAILHQPRRRRFLIVTERHGFAGGLPLLVGDGEVKSAVTFRDDGGETA